MLAPLGMTHPILLPQAGHELRNALAVSLWQECAIFVALLVIRRQLRKFFFQEGASQCQQCHRINNQGRDFGPDLSHIGAKYDRAQILDNILFPSRVIEPNFISYQLETKGELSYSGFLVKKTEEEVTLKDANAQEIRVPAGEVKSLRPQQISAMPELLLQSMTAQDVADLLEYLTSLK